MDWKLYHFIVSFYHEKYTRSTNKLYFNQVPLHTLIWKLIIEKSIAKRPVLNLKIIVVSSVEGSYKL